MSGSVTVRFRGQKGLLERLKNTPRAVFAGTAAANWESAQEMTLIARRNVHVVSGETRDSIVATPGGQSTPPHSFPGGAFDVPLGAAAVTAGNSRVRTAHLLEYGTQHSAAFPFFWPAFRSVRRRHLQRLLKALNAGTGRTQIAAGARQFRLPPPSSTIDVPRIAA